MSEIDQQTSHAIAQLRETWSPPSGVEDRMLADFHARLGGPPDGGDGGPPDGGGLPSGTGTGQWLHVVKILGAVAGLTTAGLGGLVVSAKLMRGVEQRSETSREQPAWIATSEPEAPVATHEPAPIELIEPEPEPAPAAEPLPSAAPAKPSPRPEPGAEPEPEPATVDLAAELALIRQARAAKPEQALALLDRHRREFPKGALISEREALRAAASCALDRLDDARAALTRLAALEPGPLLRQRVEVACSEKIDLPTTVFARRGDGSP
jgi:hypothetical protein